MGPGRKLTKKRKKLTEFNWAAGLWGSRRRGLGGKLNDKRKERMEVRRESELNHDLVSVNVG